MAQIESNRVVITVLGKNRCGIVAEVSRVLAQNNVDIREITQSIVDEVFTMTMITSLPKEGCNFAELQDILQTSAEKLGVDVHIQREDVFNFMYRL